MKICPECKLENSDDRETCMDCGARLPETSYYEKRVNTRATAEKTTYQYVPSFAVRNIKYYSIMGMIILSLVGIILPNLHTERNFIGENVLKFHLTWSGALISLCVIDVAILVYSAISLFVQLVENVTKIKDMKEFEMKELKNK